MRSKLVSGTFGLIFAATLCKVLGAIFRIPLAEILGTQGIGIYQMIIPLYSFLFLFASGGMTAALSRLIAEKRAKHLDTKGIFCTGLIYSAVLGFFFSVLLIGIAGGLSTWQSNPAAKFAYMAAGGAIVFSSVISPLRGFFQGHESMAPTAVSQIIEQAAKVILGITLAYFLVPFGIEFGTLGAMLGLLAGEILSVIYLFIIMRIKFGRMKLFGGVSKEAFREVLRVSLPLTLAGLVLPLCAALDSVFVVKLLDGAGLDGARATSLFGLYSGMIVSVVNLPVVISIAAGVSLLPKISFSMSEGDRAGVERLIGRSFKWVWLILLPSGFGLMALAPRVLELLFPTALTSDIFATGVRLLCVGSVSLIFMGLMQFTTSVLQGLGVTTVLSFILGGAVKILFTFGLVILPGINILGLAYASLAMYAVITFSNLALIERRARLKVQTLNLAGCAVYSCIMAAAVYILAYSLNFGNVVMLVLSVLMGVFLYLLFLIPEFKKEFKGYTYPRRKL